MNKTKHDRANQDELVTVSYSRGDGYGSRLQWLPVHGTAGCSSRPCRLDAVASYVAICVVDNILRSWHTALVERVPLVSALVAIAVSETFGPATGRTFDVGRQHAPWYALKQLSGRANLHHFAEVLIAVFGGLRQGRRD